MGLAAASLLAGPVVAGESPFNGSWVADLSSQGGLPQDVYLVTRGNYTCKSCTPARSYPADGKPHAIPDDPNVISEAVTVTGPRTIVTRIVSPTMTRSTTMTVAADDRTATYVSIDHRREVKGALRTEYLARRTAPAPAGAHPVSGTWQGVRYVSVPVQLRTTELQERGDEFTYRTPLGYSFTARFGGSFVPVEGPYKGGILAAVRRIDDHRIEETRMQNGKTVAVRTYTVAPDGRTLEIATTNPESGATFRITARKQ